MQKIKKKFSVVYICETLQNSILSLVKIFHERWEYSLENYTTLDRVILPSYDANYLKDFEVSSSELPEFSNYPYH